MIKDFRYLLITISMCIVLPIPCAFVNISLLVYCTVRLTSISELTDSKAISVMG